jgi:hypothetical protein
MPTVDEETASKPIRVQIVPVETAPIERRSNLTSFTPSTTMQQILPLSNKRIQAVISVVTIATGNTGNAFLCKDAASAKDAAQGYNNSGVILGPSTFTVVGTGEFWLVSNGATNLLVGVVAEYES